MKAKLCLMLGLFLLIFLLYSKDAKAWWTAPCDTYINQTSFPFSVDASNTVYCLNATNITIPNTVTAILFNNIQNSILDCQGLSLSESSGANYAIQLTGTSYNNTIRNCNITGFYFTIYDQSGNNTFVNNTIGYVGGPADTGFRIHPAISTKIDYVFNNTVQGESNNAIVNMAGNSLYWANTINGSLSLNGVAFMSYGDVPIFFNNSIIGGDVGMKTVGGALYAYNNIIKNTRLGFHAFTKAANLTNNDFRNNTYAIYSTTTDAPNNYINNIFFDNKYGFYGGISNFTGGSMQSRDYDIWMTTNTINISSVNFTTLKLFIDGGMPAGPNNYFQQDNSSDVKIKTKSIGTLSLTRKILNLASSYVSWQDISNYSVAYNISGLKKGAYYNIWNGTNLFANFVLSNNTEDFMFGVANAMTSITTWIIVPSTTLNIECYDELTQQPICFQAYFVNNATSYNSSLSCGSFSFNTTDIPLGYTKVTITNSSYISRDYFVTIPSNPTNNITLRAYLLQSGSGSYITTFTYSNSFPSGIYGALTTIYKFINNSWVVIDQKSTDTQGKGYFYLYPWSEYQVSASYNGYTTLLSSYYPNPSYVLYLKINDVMTTSNASWIFDTVSITYSPQDTYISGLVPISYKITDSNSSLQYYSLYLRSVNSSGYVTNLWNQSTSSSPSGGIITVNLNVSNTTGTRYEVLINFKRVGYDEWNKTYTYFPSNPNYNATIFGSFPTNIIPDTLEAFKNGAFVASDTGKMLVAIFLALAAGGLAAKNSIRMGLPTSIGGTIAFIIVLGIFVAAGALGSMGWGILLLLGLTGIGINLARYIL